MNGMDQWQGAILQAAQEFNVDPRLISSIIQVESGGNPNARAPESAQAVKSGGADGLGQQTPATARALGIDPKDPLQSIRGVAKLLDENLTRYGNPQDAVLAYHGGTNQANWGPRTQNYLTKVSAAYGAPTAMAQPQKRDYSGLQQPPAAQAGAVPDYFAQRFGDPAPGAAQTVAPEPPDGIPDYFSQRFGDSAAPSAAPTAQTAAPVAAAPAAEPAPGIADQAWQGLQWLGKQGIDNANMIGRGISDALDAPSEWVAAGAEKSGLTGLLNRAGASLPTYDQQKAINIASRKAYDEAHPDPGIQGTLARAGGNLAGVMFPIAGTEAALAKGASLAADAARVAPEAAAKIGNFLRGQGGLASRMTYNAGQGAAGGALLSGGQPDVSTGDAALQGALLGAALPVAGSVLGYGKNLASSAVAPFTAAGRDRIAQQTLEGQAGKYTSAAARADNAATGAAGGAPGGSGVPTPVGGAVDRAAAGGRTALDLTEYVPGSKPTLAQATGNGGIAALERAAKGRAPNEFTERELANYAARNQYFEGIKGTPETLAEAIVAREAATAPLREASLQGALPANTNPVIKTIDDILKSPEGQRDSVVSALQKVRSKLDLGPTYGAQSDVAQLYGVRKSINDQLENVAGHEGQAAKQASRQLIQVRDSLDEAMEKAAPGFANYRKTYADLSQPINSQTYLQNLNLTDSTSNRITLPKVKAALDKIEKLRKAPGANEAKSISDEQLAGLQNLHKDLQREANSARGLSIGSNTFQNLATNQLIDAIAPGKAGAVIGGLTPSALGGALGLGVAGPLGAAAGGAVGNTLGNIGSRAMNAQGPEIEARLINRLLNPNATDTLTPKPNTGTTSLLKILSRGAGARPTSGNTD